MNRIAVSVLTFALWGSAFSQGEAIQLGAAVGVDVLVRDVFWHRDGGTLMYSKAEPNGLGLGVFSPGQFDGKVVAHLEKGETFDVHWLSNSRSALVVATREGAGKKFVRILMVEGETQSAKQIFSQSFDAKTLSGVDAHVSPLLRHAIVAFYGEKDSKNYVLCVGRNDLVASADVDKAMSEGCIIPAWSIDGTANFFKNAMVVPILGNLPVIGNFFRKNDNDSDGEKVDLKREVGQPFFSNTFRTIPPTGENVFELMPNNAVLRPVRFRGPWKPATPGRAPLTSRNHPISLQFDQSNAQDNSVWLKRGTDKGTPATLVAVHASQVWLAPKEGALAYAIDGALFVRTIMAK